MKARYMGVSSMTRSLRIRDDSIEKIKLSLRRNGIPNQKMLATEVGLAVSTVSNFLNGKPVDYASFTAICDCLNIDWQNSADWGNNDEPLPPSPPQHQSNSEFSKATSLFEMTSGAVPINSPFYVERPPIEERCLAAVIQPHSLIRIKSPQQMGKTSLMERILSGHTGTSGRATRAEHRTVKINLQSADEAVFANLDTFLIWFCNKISWKLQLNLIANDSWSEIFGSKDNCTAFFEEQILPAAQTPLILGLDDVDRVFKYPHIAADFFGLLRSWYEESGTGEWSKLRMVIAHATEVYIPLHSDESPFNVGLPIELSEFTAEQVQILVDRHKLGWSQEQILDLMNMVGGHPYLISLALYHVNQQAISLNDFLNEAPTEAAPYGNHLRSLWNRVKSQPALLDALQTLMQTTTAQDITPELSFQLCSMGLAVRRGNLLEPRCQLYQRYFSRRGNS
jgi:transcriptional regulator with XRE-family HTH domain